MLVVNITEQHVESVIAYFNLHPYFKRSECTIWTCVLEAIHEGQEDYKSTEAAVIDLLLHDSIQLLLSLDIS